MPKNIVKYTYRLAKLHEKDGYRKLRDIENKGNTIVFEGKEMINLSSNDYLGLGFNEDLLDEFYELAQENKQELGLTSASSRLLTGNHLAYTALEKHLADTFEREAALVLNSGYHANTGILSALADKNDLIIADKLVHASIIDGINLSRAEMIRFRHLDYEQLAEILSKRREEFENVFIVSESVFSMDGDLADLQMLIDIKNEFDAYLYIDEAHAIGTRGVNGLGCCEEQVCIDDVDFIVGTFGKAMASMGAYCICDTIFKEYLINHMRPLIFTTALPPVNVAWTDFIFNKLPELHDKRMHLEDISNQLRDAIVDMGYKTLGDSNIVPLITGTNESAIALSDYLKDNSFFALPVRQPSVPSGSSRIRFSLNANIEEWQMDQLIEILRNYHS
jgi:8-amino-7-oxononanoate synthase